MDLSISTIDNGNQFDFGRTSKEYSIYRDIYPENLYEKLLLFGIGLKGQNVLDLGTGTGIIPRHMYQFGASFVGTDISESQINEAIALSKGMKIGYRVCPSEDTGFNDDSFDIVTACQCFHYFDTSKFIPELRRILKPKGKFCKIFMEWLPYEDEIVSAMEKLVLKYNPNWTGGGFKQLEFKTPEWSRNCFEIETIHTYREFLPFTIDSWCGRIRTCRGIGASLSPSEINEFDKEHRALLAGYTEDTLNIKHEIQIEIYRLY